MTLDYTPASQQDNHACFFVGRRRSDALIFCDVSRHVGDENFDWRVPGETLGCPSGDGRATPLLFNAELGRRWLEEFEDAREVPPVGDALYAVESGGVTYDLLRVSLTWLAPARLPGGDVNQA